MQQSICLPEFRSLVHFVEFAKLWSPVMLFLLPCSLSSLPRHLLVNEPRSVLGDAEALDLRTATSFDVDHETVDTRPYLADLARSQMHTHNEAFICLSRSALSIRIAIRGLARR